VSILSPDPLTEKASTRIIQEYVPGRQVTIAHVIANPDKPLCQRVGLEQADAIGIMTVTPGESAIIAGVQLVMFPIVISWQRIINSFLHIQIRS
jgi:ethanolamine utilization protein EutS